MFRQLSPGEELQIISNHEPIHLIEQIRHEGLSMIESYYTSLERSDGSYQTTLVRGDEEPYDGTKFTSIDKERLYLNEKFSPVGIYSSDSYKVILTYLKSGQCIPVHSPAVDLIL